MMEQQCGKSAIESNYFLSQLCLQPHPKPVASVINCPVIVRRQLLEEVIYYGSVLEWEIYDGS